MIRISALNTDSSASSDSDEDSPRVTKEAQVCQRNIIKIFTSLDGYLDPAYGLA